MDLDTIDLKRLLRLKVQDNRGYRANKERERRRRNNLYYNCGKFEYRAIECNSKLE